MNVGKKIHAVDENGHWAAGRIRRKDGDQFLVSFIGWASKFDRLVTAADIREPCVPRHKQFVESHTRNTNINDDRQMSYVKGLVAGDNILVNNVDKTLLRVDSFNHVVEVTAGGEIEAWPMSQIAIVDDSEKEEEQINIPKKKKRKASAEEREHAQDLKHVGTQTEDISCSSLLCNQKFVGHLYKFSSLVVAVHKLTIHGEATCYLVSNDQLDKGVTIQLSVSRLGESVAASKSMAKTLNEWRQSASEETVLNLKEPAFRDKFRRDQLAGVVQKEIKACLKGTAPRRTFVIGPVMPGEEMALFQLVGVGNVTFGYRDDRKSLSLLDDVLGLRWDILSTVQGTKYVTCLKLSVNSELCLSGSVAVALCRSAVCPESYRLSLKEDIESSQFFVSPV